MRATVRLNAKVSGPAGARAIVFAHGFGCDQNMWRFVAPAFEQDFQVVLFDHVGAGGSDVASYDPQRYSSLEGYADDVVDLIEDLGVGPVIFVGHSVSSMIGVIAAVARPELFAKLVLVGPSPRYIDDGDYVGGFSATDIDELLESMGSNYLGWAHGMAPVIMANPDQPELAGELTESFCRTDPKIAHRFAEVTFRSDNRSDLAKVTAPTLVLQCREDLIAPMSVGEYVRDQLPDATFVVLDAVGHCPHLSAPGPTTDAIGAFVRS
jgi:sigma-B regulation protein RsbQ